MGQSTAVRQDDSVNTEELTFHELPERSKAIKQTCSFPPTKKLSDGLIILLGKRKIEGFNDERYILIQEPKDGIRPVQWRKPVDGITLTGGKISYQMVVRNKFDNLRDYLEQNFRSGAYDNYFRLEEIRDSDEGDLIAFHLVEKQRNKHYHRNGH